MMLSGQVVEVYLACVMLVPGNGGSFSTHTHRHTHAQKNRKKLNKETKILGLALNIAFPTEHVVHACSPRPW